MLWAEIEDNPKATTADLEEVYERHATDPAFATSVAEAAVSGIGGVSPAVRGC